MKRMQKVACVLWLAGLSCLMATILTSWNDKAFLPLALTFIMAANYSGIACEKLQQVKAAGLEMKDVLSDIVENQF